MPETKSVTADNKQDMCTLWLGCFVETLVSSLAASGLMGLDLNQVMQVSD